MDEGGRIEERYLVLPLTPFKPLATVLSRGYRF
jgi:hypothetical protein